MKFITLKKQTLEDFLQRFVDTKDPAYDKKAAFANMRKTIWETMLQPMQLQKDGDIAFLNTLVKCQDVIKEVLADPEFETAAMEDADFEIFYKHFMEYKGWNPQFARVILTASECLKHAQSGNTLGGKSERSKEERTPNRRSGRAAKT